MFALDVAEQLLHLVIGGGRAVDKVEMHPSWLVGRRQHLLKALRDLRGPVMMTDLNKEAQAGVPGAKDIAANFRQAELPFFLGSG